MAILKQIARFGSGGYSSIRRVLGRLLGDVDRWVLVEDMFTFFGAEVVSLALKLTLARRLIALDVHPADRIDCGAHHDVSPVVDGSGSG
jgi:hypothetical protein